MFLAQEGGSFMLSVSLENLHVLPQETVPRAEHRRRQWNVTRMKRPDHGTPGKFIKELNSVSHGLCEALACLPMEYGLTKAFCSLLLP